jgi:diamine N-acetyltransferase
MIVLIPITVQNWEAAASLELEDDQQDFIRSNAWSIAESLYHPELKPFGIYRGGTMVGFLMYGKSYRSERTWLYRLMIDKHYQGQGLGKQAMEILIRRMRDEGYDEISVGYDPENFVAEQLYARFGFQSTGMAEWGEKTARLLL